MNTILFITFSYLIGSIPFSYIFPKLFKNMDISKVGSGNTGTTNVIRSAGMKVGVLAFICDFLKGFFPMLYGIAQYKIEIALLAGFFTILGHCFSIFYNWKGGKGVATSAGMIAAFSLPIFAIIAVIHFSILFVTRYMSAGSLASALAFPLLIIIFQYQPQVIAIAFLISALVIFQHRGNIYRLYHHKERKFNLRKK